MMKNIPFVIPMLSLLLMSCTHVANPPVNHIIEIDKKGNPNMPGGDAMLDTKAFDAHLEKVLDFGDKKKIIIYIHGGLNTIKSSEERAKWLSDELIKEDYHPVFIHWRSGLFTSYGEHLFTQRQGEHWSFWGPVSSPWVLVMDFGKAIARTPMVWFYQSISYLKALGYQTPKVKNAMNISRLLEQDESFDYSEGEDSRSAGMEVSQGVFGVGQFIISLVTAPIFDAVGTGAWDVMKRRTDILFTKADTDSNVDLKAYAEGKQGALVQFFEKLKDKVTDPSTGKPREDYEITLVGHSMGTIVASQILSRWQEIRYRKIIFMAAACTIKDFELSVVPYMRQGDTHFYNYVLHRKAENYESHFWGLGGVGSLLVQIDNFYANPVSEKERTFGKWENVMNGINYIPQDIQDRIHIRAMPYDLEFNEWIGVSRHQGYPVKHGLFGSAYGFWKDDLSRQMQTE